MNVEVTTAGSRGYAPDDNMTLTRSESANVCTWSSVWPGPTNRPTPARKIVFEVAEYVAPTRGWKFVFVVWNAGVVGGSITPVSTLNFTCRSSASFIGV